MPRKGTREPTFNNAKDSGQRQHVLPGNRSFSPGDLIPKPGGGGAGPSGPGTTESEDDFRFVLSREEVLDLFFEDLELPDLVKLNLKQILSFKPRRAGFTASGAPTNINVGRTMRNSHGRRIALRRPKQAELDAIAEQIAELESKPASPAIGERLEALRKEFDQLERRRKRIAYVDPVDIRSARRKMK